MEDTIGQLKKIGLTEYEAKVYIVLLNRQLDGATRLSNESGVPRTKIYSVLEALEQKGWIKIYSGYPLLFKAKHPKVVLEKLKVEHDRFLNSISTKIDEEMVNMTEKYVITNFNVGLENLKNELEKAKTVWMSNMTTELLKKLKDSISDGTEVKVVLFPGEDKVDDENIEYKEAMMKIIHLVRGKETPSSSIILDEERFFTAFKDPVNNKYYISEMLYDDCTNCFRDWYKLGWGESYSSDD